MPKRCTLILYGNAMYTYGNVWCLFTIIQCIIFKRRFFTLINFWIQDSFFSRQQFAKRSLLIIKSTLFHIRSMVCIEYGCFRYEKYISFLQMILWGCFSFFTNLRVYSHQTKEKAKAKTSENKWSKNDQQTSTNIFAFTRSERALIHNTPLARTQDMLPTTF